MRADSPLNELLTSEERERLDGMLGGTVPMPESIWQYVRDQQRRLANDLRDKVPVYLDSRFWIDLRRASAGSTNTRATSLLPVLRKAVHAGKAFCPISTSTFSELLRHGNQEVRVDTARLVDELSLGVSLVSMDELFDAEIAWLVDRPGDHKPDPEVVPIWTRLSYALGTMIPHNPLLNEKVMLALQVATFDTLWRMDLTTVAKTMVESFPPTDFDQAAVRVTRDSRAQAHEATDYETTYASEAVGVTDFCAPIFLAHMQRRAQATRAPIPTESVENLRHCRNILANLLVQETGRQTLRSAHIRAALHAIIRHNRERRFRGNDLFDIEHAVAGVGYCRAFLTESSLRTALTQAPLSLDKFYDCFVTNDIGAAIAFIEAL